MRERMAKRRGKRRKRARVTLERYGATREECNKQVNTGENSSRINGKRRGEFIGVHREGLDSLLSAQDHMSAKVGQLAKLCQSMINLYRAACL